jgi:pyruvate/2-oxoglutarate dehydrogenase complex dihydrolipoamide dehydrogenase (E3) component
VPYLTNETLWSLREKPRHLIVLGAGPVGIEMAQAHRRLGCEVTVIEAERALAREEPELAALLLARLRAEGIVLHESAPARAVSQSGGVITVEFGAGQTVSGSHLLLALGRRPALGRLNLAAAGIDPARPLVSGPTMRTANRRVYAIGDAAGGQQFTHVAGYQAGVILRALLFGLPAKARTDHVPRAVYTEPELAHVGLTEAEARARHGAALQVVTADLSHNDRTIAGGGADGRIKVMIHRGRPVGAGIVGPQAGELIGLWSLVLAQKLKISAISGTILPYPTLSEVSKRAAGAYFTPRLFENPWVKRVVRLVQRFRR